MGYLGLWASNIISPSVPLHHLQIPSSTSFVVLTEQPDVGAFKIEEITHVPRRETLRMA